MSLWLRLLRQSREEFVEVRHRAAPRFLKGNIFMDNTNIYRTVIDDLGYAILTNDKDTIKSIQSEIEQPSRFSLTKGLTDVQKKYIIRKAEKAYCNIIYRLSIGLLSPLEIPMRLKSTNSSYYTYYISRYLEYLHRVDPCKANGLAKKIFKDIHNNSNLAFPDHWDSELKKIMDSG